MKNNILKISAFVAVLAMFMAITPVLAQGSLSLSQTNINLNVGQNMTVTVFPPSGQIVNVTAISNTYVAYANITNNIVTVYGLSSGTSQIQLSTNDNSSATIFVTVGTGSNNTGTISFSQNNVNLNVGQSTAVSIFNNNSNFNTYSISSNSNSNVVSASISGSTINLYGQNPGSSTITVYSNQNSNNFATLFVTVGNGNNSGNMYFSAQVPTQAVVGQYYSYSLQVLGGNSPYVYNLYSGSLPAGLTLGSNGIISGTPTTAGNYNFSVRVADYLGRSLISGAIVLNAVNPGTVAGSSIYANGTLINEGGTVYIVYKNTKTGFANLAAFAGLGYKSRNVLQASDASLVNSGFVIGSANIAHPWGSWIQTGNTVYFVHDQGLIPISSYNVFINNGGRDNLVVMANNYDFSKPILDIMGLSDPRLR